MAISIAFFGTPEFSVPTLQALLSDHNYSVSLVITQPDRPAGRGQRFSPSPIKELALNNGIPVFQPTNLKKNLKADLLELQKYNAIDLGIVVAFGQVLPQAILNWPKFGCLNIHASLLPRWRGAAPIQRAIMHGDAETGLCLMRMEAGLDTGPVYCSAKIAITNEDNFGSLHDSLSQLGAALLIKNLPAILNNEIKAIPQSDIGITYASKFDVQDQIINWTKTATQIFNQVRANSPFPGAYTNFEGQRLKIFQARPGQDTNAHAPGTVVRSDKNQLAVQTGSGLLELEQLQLAGKKRLATKDFLNGVDLRAGTILSEYT